MLEYEFPCCCWLLPNCMLYCPFRLHGRLVGSEQCRLDGYLGLVRWCLIRENIAALDQASVDAFYGRNGFGGDTERVKLLITLVDGNNFAVVAPRGLVLAGFTNCLLILNPHRYSFSKGVGWVFFGVHVLSLGQSDFLSQIWTVVLLIGSSWATAKGLGCNDYKIGHHISVKRVESNPSMPDKRMWLYVWMECEDHEEEYLANWCLLPRKSNTQCWQTFQESNELWESQVSTKSLPFAEV
jgi:hypothetical protein